MGKYSLVLDGSTYAGTVALLSAGDVVGERSLPDSGIPVRGQRGEDFMPMVVECMAEAGVSVGELDRVICGAGPGSFTSLRIAASIAKGIASGAGIPLFAVSSLLLIPTGSDVLAGNYLIALPAMRGESYALNATVFADVAISTDGVVRLVATPDVEGIAVDDARELIGPGFGKDLRPHARGAALMIEQILASEPCDLDTWEPAYGRLAEAQVKWEAVHGRPLGLGA